VAEKAKRPTGRVKGVSVPASQKTRVANRTRAWKHGGYSKSVSLREGSTAKLRQVHPEAPEMLKAYTDILVDGNVDGRKRLAAMAFAGQEIILRRATEKVLEIGELVEEAVIGPDGTIRKDCVKLKANPLLDTVIRLNENLGYTAEQQELTPRSKKEGAADVALEAAARREMEILDGMDRLMQRRGAKDPRVVETTVAR
jgi:hypothetical protein